MQLVFIQHCTLLSHHTHIQICHIFLPFHWVHGFLNARILNLFANLFDLMISQYQFSSSVVSDSLWPHGLQHPRLPCPSATHRAYSNSCPLNHWCHPTISSSVVPFSWSQSFSASRSFSIRQLFALDGQNTGVSASASGLPMNIQDWFLLGWTCLISLQSMGLSRVFSNTTVQKHQFFGTQLPL